MNTFTPVAVVGPVSDELHLGFDTGERWNGSPVIGFTAATMAALILAGDLRDANGEGITVSETGTRFLDVTDGDVEEVPMLLATPDADDPVRLYVPQGRAWDLFGEPATDLPDPADDALDLIAAAAREVKPGCCFDGNDPEISALRDALDDVRIVLRRTGRDADAPTCDDDHL